MRIIIAGGGWGGCAAAAAARKAGADVVLLERADMLLGTGLVGGIFRNNGRFTAAEEILAMGGEMFSVMDNCARHTNVTFPGHAHASLYDVYEMEPAILAYLKDLGVEVRLEASISGLTKKDERIAAVTLRKGETIEGDAFVDATGTSATPAYCIKHGNGCAMCILRCHTFSPRWSLTSEAGVEEWHGGKPDGSTGAMSGSCKLFKESLAPEIRKTLEDTGVCLVKVPEEVREGSEILDMKACQQYALKDFVENIVLLDTGPAKLMTPYFPLEDLRKIPGFEKARYEDPIGGTRGNSMRYFHFAACSPALQAEGKISNLFCAGEKAGAMVGHTEAIVTGYLAGHNAVRYAKGLDLISYPKELAVGDFVDHVISEMRHPEGRQYKYTFSGSIYFERMRHRGLYSTEVAEISRKVLQTGWENRFSRKV